MKRIFELTKPEQRVVILIVAALVAIAFARHWFTKPQPPTSATSISASPTATPTILRTQQESDSDD